MKNNKANTVLGVFQVITIVLLLVVVFHKTEEGTKLVTACPDPNPIVKEEHITRNVIQMDGWECRAPKMPGEGGSDLLQPSGYWALDNVSCFKIITPISQWCAENDPMGKRCSKEQQRGDLDPK